MSEDILIEGRHKRKSGLRWTIVSSFLGSVVLLLTIVTLTTHQVSELSESSALALAAKYFGFPQKGPSTLTERQSDFSIDPVTPFDNMPDPDAPSKAEMMENFSKRTASSVSLKSLRPAQTAQLAMHNFFIPPPSPMYEQSEDPEPSGHTAMLKGSTATAHSTASGGVARDQSESGPTIAAHGLNSVKPYMIHHNAKQDMQKPGDKFATAQHGIFDIFEDHSVAVSAKKTQAAAAIKAKHKALKSLDLSAIKRKTRLDQVEQEQAAHAPKPSLLVKEPTHAAAVAVREPAAAHVPAPAAEASRVAEGPAVSAEGRSAPERETAAAVAASAAPASSAHAPPKPGRAAIDYGGIFGDPFEDNAVDATAARHAQPSWF